MVELYKSMAGMLEETRTIQKAIPSTMLRTLTMLAPDGSTSSPSDPSRRDQLVICPHPSNLTKLRRFMNDQDVRFTCPEQSQALEAVVGGTDHVFLIGPTGMGKTSVFLIPAKESPDKVTIVLVPLSALRVDFSRRCRALGIMCSEWAGPGSSKTTIVMVSPENAAKQSFLAWASGLKSEGRLLRFVYDEVHMLKMHVDFRQCFESHRRFTELGKCPVPLHHI